VSADSLAPRDAYFIVVRCVCGRRVRASSLMRAWADRPAEATFADAEMMVTKSAGPGKLTNLRSPLWTALNAPTDVRARVAIADRVAEFFRRMEVRMGEVARASRDASLRARWG
jgi:hypothetical protein